MKKILKLIHTLTYKFPIFDSLTDNIILPIGIEKYGEDFEEYLFDKTSYLG